MTIVFDVMINGKVKETIEPANQRLQEMYWFVIDRIENLKVKHGDNVSVHKRLKYV